MPHRFSIPATDEVIFLDQQDTQPRTNTTVSAWKERW
jgi:hypothetical protein